MNNLNKEEMENLKAKMEADMPRLENETTVAWFIRKMDKDGMTIHEKIDLLGAMKFSLKLLNTLTLDLGTEALAHGDVKLAMEIGETLIESKKEIELIMAEVKRLKAIKE